MFDSGCGHVVGLLLWRRVCAVAVTCALAVKLVAVGTNIDEAVSHLRGGGHITCGFPLARWRSHRFRLAPAWCWYAVVGRVLL
jgi:hypothetical protein